jgi:hypothetical protein
VSDIALPAGHRKMSADITFKAIPPSAVLRGLYFERATQWLV